MAYQEVFPRSDPGAPSQSVRNSDGELEAEWEALQQAIEHRRDSAAKSELAAAARLNKEAAVLSLQEGEEAWAKQAGKVRSVYTDVVPTSLLKGRPKEGQRQTRQPREQIPALEPQAQPQELHYAELALENAWECPACTYHNPLDRSSCEICLTAHDGTAKKVRTESPLTGDVPRQSTAADRRPSRQPKGPVRVTARNPGSPRTQTMRHKDGHVLVDITAGYLEPPVPCDDRIVPAESLAAALARAKAGPLVTQRRVRLVLRQRAVHVIDLQSQRPLGRHLVLDGLAVQSSGRILALLVAATTEHPVCHLLATSDKETALSFKSTIATVLAAPTPRLRQTRPVSAAPGSGQSPALIPAASQARTSQTLKARPSTYTSMPSRPFSFLKRRSSKDADMVTAKYYGSFPAKSSAAESIQTAVVSVREGSIEPSTIRLLLDQHHLHIHTLQPGAAASSEDASPIVLRRNQVLWAGGCPQCPTHLGFIADSLSGKTVVHLFSRCEQTPASTVLSYLRQAMVPDSSC